MSLRVCVFVAARARSKLSLWRADPRVDAANEECEEAEVGVDW